MSRRKREKVGSGVLVSGVVICIAVAIIPLGKIKGEDMKNGWYKRKIDNDAPSVVRMQEVAKRRKGGAEEGRNINTQKFRR